MADQIVITEKSSQAKDVRAAVGSRYGDILPAEGHLFDLLEPGDVVPAWKRWSPILLRPEGLYGTRPAEGGNKAAKLRAIRERCAPPGALLGVAISNGHGTFPPTPAMKRFADKVKHRSAKSEAAAIRRAEGMSRDPANAGGGRVQACRRSEVGEFSERGRIEEVWRCAE
jgi:hypothetical protein